jgi:hypothetical protein
MILGPCSIVVACRVEELTGCLCIYEAAGEGDEEQEKMQ